MKMVLPQSGFAFLHQYHQQNPLDLDDDEFVRLHEWFLRNLSAIDTLAEFAPGELAIYRNLCSRCQKRYLVIKEASANKSLLALGRNAGPSIGQNLGGFGRKVYDRVSDLKKFADFGNCKNIVMVGSGAFPATLLWLHDNFPTLHYVGLDIDPCCVKMATALMTVLEIGNIHFELCDGRLYDFDGTDFVYVANHVVAKKAVLVQIACSKSVRHVVVREPNPVGELLAESVRCDLPPAFVVRGAGVAGGISMSYDLLLGRI